MPIPDDTTQNQALVDSNREFHPDSADYTSPSKKSHEPSDTTEYPPPDANDHLLTATTDPQDTPEHTGVINAAIDTISGAIGSAIGAVAPSIAPQGNADTANSDTKEIAPETDPDRVDNDTKTDATDPSNPELKTSKKTKASKKGSYVSYFNSKPKPKTKTKTKLKAKQKDSHGPSAKDDEDAPVIGNAWNILNWYNADKQERRYLSGDEMNIENAVEGDSENNDNDNNDVIEENEPSIGADIQHAEDDISPLNSQEYQLMQPLALEGASLIDENLDNNTSEKPTSEKYDLFGIFDKYKNARDLFDKRTDKHSLKLDKFDKMSHSEKLDLENKHDKHDKTTSRLTRAKFTRAGSVQKLKKFLQPVKHNRKPGDGVKEEHADDLESDINQDHLQRTRVRTEKIINQLATGSPVVNILATCFIKDDQGFARVPLLLLLLGITVVDILKNVNTRNRLFRIDLEYGVGRERMRWSVNRSAKDLLYLHSRLKIEYWRSEIYLIRKPKADKDSNFPKYPVPPRMQRTRRSERERLTNTINSNNDAVSISSSIHTFRNHLMGFRLRLSSVSLNEVIGNQEFQIRMKKNQEYTSEVENYLINLTLNVAPILFSNRIFQFFELSPILSLLSYERNWVGKQGTIHIGGNTKKQGWRVGHFRANDVKGMIDRRQEKWLLVRGSYVMYVSNINLTTPLEVFLVDPYFEIKCKHRDLDSTLDSGKNGSIRNGESEVPDDDLDNDDEGLDGSINEHINPEIGANLDDKLALTSATVFKYLKITLQNNERQLVLIPKLKKEQRLWLKSLEAMKEQLIYSQTNRFDSFAPVRKNCYAQWIVDGRDHFWAISSALEMAKDVIFIHDWWLSPELYLRRPANGNQQWRLDRVLKRKAQQGVKIFVIVYRNVGTTVATDSLYTKHLILLLDEENIHVIRLPNQLLQNTFFWAHHEKLCIIDYKVAFVGGIDLCYGRFDTPDHVLADDSRTAFGPPSSDTANQVFVGKDYLNPRVKDFYGLERPYDEMYDRENVPRMPWHDVHLLTSGHTAVDLARHFVQRWNYLLRQKRPLRPTPLLTPPPDLTEEEVEEMGLGGTCEVQILRLLGSWLLGLQQHEQSIQNAYLKLIETLEHFVYIENQFFVTLCVIDGTEIKNRIGDALVDRIIRAHQEGKQWRAMIVIPLMPGFESQVDEPDGLSVRVIMQCQYLSILRGATSIFAKLTKYGIEPDDYIQFFSLRKWDVIGKNRTLVTEQLYIHAKTMIADDRAAIIGSANINERLMRGIRDLEVAAVVRDSDTIQTTMNGKPYLAGKFPHTLRMRLMREHLGVDVDVLEMLERRFHTIKTFASSPDGLKYATRTFSKKEDAIISAMVELAKQEVLGTDAASTVAGLEAENYEEDDSFPPLPLPVSFNNRTGSYEANKGIRDKKKHSYDPRVQQNPEHKDDVDGYGLDGWKKTYSSKTRINSVKIMRDLSVKYMKEDPGQIFLPNRHEVEEYLEKDPPEESEAAVVEKNKERLLLLKKLSYVQRTAAVIQLQKEAEIKRRVAAGMPKNIQLKDNFIDDMASPDDTSDNAGSSGPEGMNSATEKNEDIAIVLLDEQGVVDLMDGINSKEIETFTKFVDPFSFEDPLDPAFYEDLWFEHARRNTEIFRLIFHCQPDDLVVSWKDYKKYLRLQLAFMLAQKQEAKFRRRTVLVLSSSEDDSSLNLNEAPQNVKGSNLEDEVNGLLGHTPDSMKLNLGEKEKHKKKKNKFGNKLRHPGKSAKSIEDIDEEDEDGVNNKSKSIVDGMESDLEVLESGYEDDFEDNNETTRENGAYASETSYSNGNPSTLNEYSPYSMNDKEREMGARNHPKRRRRKRFGTFSGRRRILSDEKVYDRETSERILNEIVGNLVFFPVDWLMTALEGGNWFFNTDRLPPIEIYD